MAAPSREPSLREPSLAEPSLAERLRAAELRMARYDAENGAENGVTPRHTHSKE